MSDRAGIAPAPVDLSVSWRKFWWRPFSSRLLLVPVAISRAARRVSMRWVGVLACVNRACFDRFFEGRIRVEEIGIVFGEERDVGS